MSIRQW